MLIQRNPRATEINLFKINGLDKKRRVFHAGEAEKTLFLSLCSDRPTEG
jgi:hypothetical protein